jgi:FtsP/CotA-like multicopper oxidase with cupredoxin domain
MSEQTVDRRKFLTLAGAAGLGLGIAACSTPPVPVIEPTPAPSEHVMDATATPDPAEVVAEMDAMHEQGVTDFVKNLSANNEIFWTPAMPFTMDGDTKVFDITMKPVVWEIAPGKTVETFSYNGIVPGPEIRVTEGDKLRFQVKNELPESSSIHWHGIHLPNKMDGVPFVTQPPIKPGESFTYEFVAKPAGSHMYHSHHNAADQVTRGLLGAFVVEPKDKSKDPEYDSDYTMVLNDYNVGLTINGKSFPATGAIVAEKGERIRVRFMNEGLQIHPMHLHGFYMTVFAQDGFNLPQPYNCDVLNIAPGQRFDVLIEADEPGVWAFHCHILNHAESAHGMFGMVTALIVNEA